MAIRIKADVTSAKSLTAAIEKMRLLDMRYITPAADELVTSYVAKDVRDRMAELVHTYEDNIHNDDTLLGKIDNAPIEHKMMGLVQIPIRKTRRSSGWLAGLDNDPLMEATWGNRYNGNTPPPHDFRRENQKVASEMAQEHWNEIRATSL